jgi:MFS family permease
LALYEPLFVDQCVEKAPLLADPGACVAESLRATGSIPVAVVASAPIGLVSFVYLSVMGIQVILFLLPMQLPFYLLQSMGASSSRSGLAIAGMSGAYALASMQYGRVASRLDHSGVLVVAVGLIGAGYFAIWAAGGWAIMVSGLVVAGIGQGLLSPNLSIWLAEATPTPLRGRVVGGLTTATFLGIFVSPIISQPMVAAMGFRALCLSAGLLLLIAATLFWVMRNQLRTLTGPIPLEPPGLDTDTGSGEAETAALLQSLNAGLTTEGEQGDSPMPQCSPYLCSEGLPPAR